MKIQGDKAMKYILLFLCAVVPFAIYYFSGHEFIRSRELGVAISLSFCLSLLGYAGGAVIEHITGE